jgi:hypothetical protein
MDNQPLWKNRPIIILNQNQKIFIHNYIMNSTAINAQEKRFLLNGLKPRKKRRV